MCSSVAVPSRDIFIQLVKVSWHEQQLRDGRKYQADSRADCTYPDNNSLPVVSAVVRNSPVNIATGLCFIPSELHLQEGEIQINFLHFQKFWLKIISLSTEFSEQHFKSELVLQCLPALQFSPEPKYNSVIQCIRFWEKKFNFSFLK